MDLTPQINSVLAQFTVLSWTSILATVGFSEVYAHRQKQKGLEKPLPWFFAPLLGASIGVFQTLSKINGENWVNVLFMVISSAFIYAGLVPITYLIILKPFKSLIDLVQSKTNSIVEKEKGK